MRAIWQALSAARLSGRMEKNGQYQAGEFPLDTAQHGNLRERGLNMGKQVYLVDTPVATVWTSAQSPGAGDEEALRNPANMKQWLTGLSLEQRHELWRKNKIQTQVLYGLKVIVHKTEGKWAYISVPEQRSSKHPDGYPGWVPRCQLKQGEGWPQDAAVCAVKKPFAMLYDENQLPLFEVSFQTRFFVVDETKDQFVVKTVHGKPASLKKQDVQLKGSSPGSQNRYMLDAGKMFLGLPYLWGGMSGYGYDCSGFSYTMVLAATGRTIARDAHEQAKGGAAVPLGSIAPGDLLFFAHEEGRGVIHHVGIYAGEGKLLHSPKTGRPVELLDMEGTIYEKELCCARRYWM